jgi:uncharacterized repeat protein (TIGR03803 family)
MSVAEHFARFSRLRLVDPAWRLLAADNAPLILSFLADLFAQTSEAEAILYLFRGGSTDGADPSGALVQNQDGNVYGTTAQVGEFNAGSVFRITPAGVETLLHSFGGGTAMNP